MVSAAELGRLHRGLPENVEITDSHIENENDPDANLIVKFNCVFNFDKGTNNFFMNASMIRFFSKNPFEARVRKLPIEFPYKTELAYNMNIILPPNLVPDSVAAPMEQDYEKGTIRYKKNTGYFPQLHTFTISTSLLINNTTFTKDHYSDIRAFFQKVVDEDNKMIVFKKTGN